MNPISKPTIDNIITNVKTALRNGLYTVYDICQFCANGTNNCINWVNTNGATLKENEDDRIENETTRIKAEGSTDPDSEYYGGRAKAEADRVSAEQVRSEAEGVRDEAEYNRLVAEGSADKSSSYYGGRAKAEADRVSAEQARLVAEGSNNPSSPYYGGRAKEDFERNLTFLDWEDKMNAMSSAISFYGKGDDEGQITKEIELSGGRYYVRAKCLYKDGTNKGQTGVTITTDTGIVLYNYQVNEGEMSLNEKVVSVTNKVTVVANLFENTDDIMVIDFQFVKL